MNRIATVLAAFAIVALVSVGCSRKVDTTKYVPVCEKIMKCNKVGTGNPLVGQYLSTPEACLKYFAKSSKKLAGATERMVACINEAKCEELKVDVCFAKSVQGMQEPMMGK